MADEPPTKIKKENLESSSVVIKEESRTDDEVDAGINSLVNHRARNIPAWLQIPGTCISSNVEVKLEIDATAKKPEIKTEPTEEEVTSVLYSPLPLPSTSNSSPTKGNDDAVSSSSDVQKPVCRFGKACYRLNAQHRQDYYHPSGSDPLKSPEKPHCRYGARCYRKNEEHRNRFIHPRPPYNVPSSLSSSIEGRLRNSATQTFHYFDDPEDNDDLEDFLTDASMDEYNPSDEEDTGSETDFELDPETDEEKF